MLHLGETALEKILFVGSNRNILAFRLRERCPRENMPRPVNLRHVSDLISLVIAARQLKPDRSLLKQPDAEWKYRR
jgi:hypothetical protein